MDFRWRGTIISIASLAMGAVLFYGFYRRGFPAVKPLLFFAVIGAFIGGVIATIDSARAIRERQKDRRDRHR